MYTYVRERERGVREGERERGGEGEGEREKEKWGRGCSMEIFAHAYQKTEWAMNNIHTLTHR